MAVSATQAAEGRLKATTVPLERPTDLISEAGEHGLLWRGDHAGIAGNGVALTIDMRDGTADTEASQQVVDILASIDCEDHVGAPGSGPVAIGALPFDRDIPARLVVPRRIVGFDGEKAWLTTVEPAGGEEGPAAPTGSPPDQFSLVSSMPHTDWRAVVAAAVDAIKRGELRKVVIARRIDISANRPFVVSDVMRRLEALYPSCMLFSVGGFLGASPELLIRRTGSVVESHPLAGTVARSGDQHSDQALVDALMASPKARHEHQVVVDVLRQKLAEVCSDVQVPDEPTVVGLRNVSHLGTRITAELAPAPPGRPLPSALELAAMVHPTPAVGGNPTADAVRYLREVEGFDRGCYAGPVGWVDARGDGAFAVGIRCAEVSGARARLYAGNGVVEGSDPEEELAETQLKLQALLAALVRP